MELTESEKLVTVYLNKNFSVAAAEFEAVGVFGVESDLNGVWVKKLDCGVGGKYQVFEDIVPVLRYKIELVRGVWFDGDVCLLFLDDEKGFLELSGLEVPYFGAVFAVCSVSDDHFVTFVIFESFEWEKGKLIFGKKVIEVIDRGDDTSGDFFVFVIKEMKCFDSGMLEVVVVKLDADGESADIVVRKGIG